MQRRAFQGLEPCDGKLSRTVLRGKRGRKAPALPGTFLLILGTSICCSKGLIMRYPDNDHIRLPYPLPIEHTMVYRF